MQLESHMAKRNIYRQELIFSDDREMINWELKRERGHLLEQFKEVKTRDIDHIRCIKDK